MIKATGISVAAAVSLFGAGWGGLQGLDARYAASGAVQQLSVDIWYGQFFDRLDDLQETQAEGNDELAEVYRRQLQRLLAKICAVEPEFEYCEDGIPD